RGADLLQRGLHPTAPLQGMSDDVDGNAKQSQDASEAPGEAGSAASAPGGSASASWRRIYLMARPRLTRANLFALLLACLLGFALATQVRQTQEQGLEDLRQDELVRILDDVTQNGNRLDDEIAELEETRDRLANSE